MATTRFHRTSRRLVVAGMLTAVAGIACPSLAQAQAQDWPNRPVTFVVPYAPGASNDTFTRMLANVLTKRLGQPFIVSNRPGAGGFIGTEAVAKAVPDGYTFLEMPSSIAGFKPIMKVDIDPLKDLTPLALIARAPGAMVINAALPIKTVKEFIEYAKANPDKTFYGMAGIGTSNHQHAEMFKQATGLKLIGVNYKSASDAMTDLIGGRTQVVFATAASARPGIDAGQLRLLAYGDSNYPPESPKAPTFAEAGVPNMEKAQTWWAIFGPPKLPVDIQRKMNAAVNAALKDPEFLALLAKSSATPAPVTIEETIDTVKQEVALVELIPKTIDK
jgi:tripartite-type tricarboxylate transporter receptor subunit TctC